MSAIYNRNITQNAVGKTTSIYTVIDTHVTLQNLSGVEYKIIQCIQSY